MQKSLPISRCPSHSMPSQSEIESKTAHNRNATQCTPQISISTPSPPTLSFSQNVAFSFSHYTSSPFNSPPLPLLPILQHLSLTNDPIPHSSHSHSKTHKTAHFLQSPIPLPLPNLLYLPSNTHSTITSHLLPIRLPPISPHTNTLSQTHHTLPLPFANPSLTLPQKKRKHSTRTPLPAFHHSSPFKRKQPNASLQPHDSQTVGGATLDLWLVPFVLM